MRDPKIHRRIFQSYFKLACFVLFTAHFQNQNMYTRKSGILSSKALETVSVQTKQAKNSRNFERGNSGVEIVVSFLCFFFF